MIFQSVFYCLACLVFCYIAFMYTKILGLLRDENSVLKLPLHISLDEEDFNCLVRGGVLNIAYFREGRAAQVKICLKDIGFGRMNNALDNAMAGVGIQQNHNKIIGS